MFGRLKLRPDDILFSKYLRKKRGYRCERCGVIYPEGKGLQVSHYWGRKAESVRIDEENCDILCFHDHQIFEENPTMYVEWKLNKLGQKKHDALKIRAHLYKKKDVKANVLAIKQLIKNETKT